jgi:hypothetical protein
MNMLVDASSVHEHVLVPRVAAGCSANGSFLHFHQNPCLNSDTKTTPV